MDNYINGALNLEKFKIDLRDKTASNHRHFTRYKSLNKRIEGKIITLDEKGVKKVTKTNKPAHKKPPTDLARIICENNNIPLTSDLDAKITDFNRTVLTGLVLSFAVSQENGDSKRMYFLLKIETRFPCNDYR